MILIDANLLLYAYNVSSVQHNAAKGWLEETLSDTEAVRFALVSLLAFVRIATNPTVFARPLPTPEAMGIVRLWLELPQTGLAHPTERHWALLDQLVRSGQARGAMVMDAHLATLALEYGATLHTTDRDFARFPELRFIDPLSD
ncbi:MAG: type II toxin-antitoxin system VapC family toxin [Actinobacteria bacterium]|nr:type II toxin-antitoxin system VapC family toxin [Actinomycetota bacterium]MBA3629365.1 type II toxin-antitoxin system VapC family toxin [Actinomycetota bacterium]MDQ3531923.1 type II toxin-antitoxin system VapC family toxin [Actinomycetota bacterium]